ncbi:MAG: response regulator [Alphaproteobacteria bacterium]|nr:response regulator [Alphaproteobacteria bacterium]
MSNIPSSQGKPPTKKCSFEVLHGAPHQRRAGCRKLRLVGGDRRAELRPTILLAYHGRTTRQILNAALLRHGYDVSACDDGGAALQQLAVAHFDLIVSGILMPDTDGLELIRSLRSRPAPPIIAVAEACDPMSPVYLRNARLVGAVGAHLVSPGSAGLLADVDRLLDPEGRCAGASCMIG